MSDNLYVNGTIIAISGKARSGKDTVAALIEKILLGTSRTPVIVPFAQCLKDVAAKTFGLDRHKLDVDPAYKAEHRRMLVEYGQAIRSFAPTAWVDYVCREAMKSEIAMPEEKFVWIIPDLRFGNEIDRLEEVSGGCCVAVRVNASEKTRRGRMGAESWARYEADAKDDPSETELDFVAYRGVFSWYVQNDSTSDDLERQVRRFLQCYVDSGIEIAPPLAVAA